MVGGEEEDRNNQEGPSVGLRKKQKHGRRYGRRWTTLAFGSGWTALDCIDPIYIYISNLCILK